MEADTKNIKLVPIGNSRGIRLPKSYYKNMDSRKVLF